MSELAARTGDVGLAEDAVQDAFVEAIGHWALERGLWVVTDEIYEHLVYGSAVFHSMPVVVPELQDSCLVVNGVAKTYAMTGWRVGWLIGPHDAIAAATNIQSHETSRPPPCVRSRGTSMRWRP